MAKNERDERQRAIALKQFQMFKGVTRKRPTPAADAERIVEEVFRDIPKGTFKVKNSK